MAQIEGYNMPDELYYHKEHAWAKVLDDGNVLCGLDDFWAKEAGDAVSVDLPFEGDEVKQDETCGKVQTAKWIGKLCAPVGGEIIEVNTALEDDPSLINKDPYGEGWIMKIRPTSLEEELKNLYHGESVPGWIKDEIKRAEEEKKK
jgi:glycine cleavage system H protein